MKQKYSILSLCAFMCVSAFCHLAALPENLAAQIPELQKNVDTVKSCVDANASFSYYNTLAPLRVQNVFARALSFIDNPTCQLTLHDKIFTLKIDAEHGPEFCPFEVRWIPSCSGEVIDWTLLGALMTHEGWHEEPEAKDIQNKVLSILKKVLPAAADHYYGELKILVEGAQQLNNHIKALSQTDLQKIADKWGESAATLKSKGEAVKALKTAHKHTKRETLLQDISGKGLESFFSLYDALTANIQNFNLLKVKYTGAGAFDSQQIVDARNDLLAIMYKQGKRLLGLAQGNPEENLERCKYWVRKFFRKPLKDLSDITIENIERKNIKKLRRALKSLQPKKDDSSDSSSSSSSPDSDD